MCSKKEQLDKSRGRHGKCEQRCYDLQSFIDKVKEPLPFRELGSFPVYSLGGPFTFQLGKDGCITEVINTNPFQLYHPRMFRHLEVEVILTENGTGNADRKRDWDVLRERWGLGAEFKRHSESWHSLRGIPGGPERDSFHHQVPFY